MSDDEIRLTRTPENTAGIDALADALAADGGGRVGVDGLYDDLPHRLHRSRAPHPMLLGRRVREAYTWEPADRADETWWPQGVTTSVHTGFAEKHGHDVLATSWYAKDPAASRISIVDLEEQRYGHVLLVTPSLADDGTPRFEPLGVHAGGIVWHGPHLHVAATARGFHTCRMEDVLRVPAGSDLETLGHRYVLPVRSSHVQHAPETAGRLRFSFLTLDRSEDDGPTLLVGEYATGDKSRRLARFTLDEATGSPRDAAPTYDARGVRQMQGVAVVDGVTHVSSSRGPWGPGSLYAGAAEDGPLREHRWALPMGPEDLVWWPESGRLWTVTEHPRRRWIVGARPINSGSAPSSAPAPAPETERNIGDSSPA